MNRFTKALSGPVSQKIVMALTGAFLITFLIEHVIGNLMLLERSGTAFNDYAEFMRNNPLVRTIEIVLFAGFVIHIVYAAMLTYKNKRARPTQYAVRDQREVSSWFSRNMGLTGSIVFIFLVVHLNTFFIPVRVLHSTPATLYDIAIASFANPVYTGFYVLAMVLLAWHLNHGFQSAFQTLGLQNPAYTPFIQTLGTLFAIIVPGLFAFIPVYLFFTH